jgi:hypothetical protein
MDTAHKTVEESIVDLYPRSEEIYVSDVILIFAT